MSASDFVFSAGILALVVFQLWLTRKVWRSPLFDRTQKMSQSKLIWLLPVVGAVLVFSLMPEDEAPKPPSSLSG